MAWLMSLWQYEPLGAQSCRALAKTGARRFTSLRFALASWFRLPSSNEALITDRAGATGLGMSSNLGQEHGAVGCH